MPLVLPGVDESTFNKLSKRLHQRLPRPTETLSLSRLRESLAKALGYANLHAAQQTWKEAAPAAPSRNSAPSVNALIHVIEPETTPSVQAVLPVERDMAHRRAARKASPSFSAWMAVLLDHGPAELARKHQAAPAALFAPPPAKPGEARGAFVQFLLELHRVEEYLSLVDLMPDAQVSAQQFATIKDQRVGWTASGRTETLEKLWKRMLPADRCEALNKWRGRLGGETAEVRQAVNAWVDAEPNRDTWKALDLQVLAGLQRWSDVATWIEGDAPGALVSSDVGALAQVLGGLLEHQQWSIALRLIERWPLPRLLATGLQASADRPAFARQILARVPNGVLDTVYPFKHNEWTDVLKRLPLSVGVEQYEEALSRMGALDQPELVLLAVRSRLLSDEPLPLKLALLRNMGEALNPPHARRLVESLRLPERWSENLLPSLLYQEELPHEERWALAAAVIQAGGGWERELEVPENSGEATPLWEISARVLQWKPEDVKRLVNLGLPIEKKSVRLNQAWFTAGQAGMFTGKLSPQDEAVWEKSGWLTWSLSEDEWEAGLAVWLRSGVHWFCDTPGGSKSGGDRYLFDPAQGLERLRAFLERHGLLTNTSLMQRLVRHVVYPEQLIAWRRWTGKTPQASDLAAWCEHSASGPGWQERVCFVPDHVSTGQAQADRVYALVDLALAWGTDPAPAFGPNLETVLHWAARLPVDGVDQWGCALVDRLLNAGANPLARTAHGKTPLEWVPATASARQALLGGPTLGGPGSEVRCVTSPGRPFRR